MREVITLDTSCFIESSSKIIPSSVSLVPSNTSAAIFDTFVADFNSGETEAIRVIDTSYIAAQFHSFAENFPNAVPGIDACFITSATLPYISTAIYISTLSQLHHFHASDYLTITSITPPLVRQALQYGVTRYIVSNAMELETLQKEYVCAAFTTPALSDLTVLLRLQVADSIGAEMCQVTSLLQYAALLSLPILGVSFHCGSGGYDVTAHVTALQLAVEAIRAIATLGMTLRYLDIGGLIPQNGVPENDIVAINAPLLQLAESGVSITIEIGRFLLQEAGTLYLQVYDVREVEIEEEAALLWVVSEGVQGCFKGIGVPEVQLVTPAATADHTRHILAGSDLSVLHANLPFAPELGGWIRVDLMGCAKEEGCVMTRYVKHNNE